MLYVVAFFCPPLAVLLTGRFFTSIFVFFLSFLYFPGALVALLVVSGHYADKRTNRLVRASEKHHEAMMQELRNSLPARPLPAPEPEEEGADLERPLPRATIRERLLAGAERARFAYDSLPEWGQPVVWGLAAATPVVALMVAVQAMR